MQEFLSAISDAYLVGGAAGNKKTSAASLS